jgi:hypothetical protein
MAPRIHLQDAIRDGTSKTDLIYFFTNSVLTTRQSIASSRVKIHLQFLWEYHAWTVPPTVSYNGMV